MLHLPPYLASPIRKASSGTPPPAPPANGAIFTHTDQVVADSISAPATDDMLVSALTLCCWIRLPSGSPWPVGGIADVAQLYDTVAGQTTYGFFITDGVSSPFLGAVICDSTQTPVNLDLGEESSTSSFHLALRWDGSTVTLYRNAVSITSQPFAGPLWPGSATATNNFGMNNSVPGGVPAVASFHVADTRIYNTALSVGDLQNLVVGLPIAATPPHSYALSSNAIDSGSSPTLSNGVVGTSVTFGAL